MDKTTLKTKKFGFGTLILPGKISIYSQLTTDNFNNYIEIEIQENNLNPQFFSFIYNQPIYLHKLYEKQFLYKNLNNLNLSDNIKNILKKYYFPLKPTLRKSHLKLDPTLRI